MRNSEDIYYLAITVVISTSAMANGVSMSKDRSVSMWTIGNYINSTIILTFLSYSPTKNTCIYGQDIRANYIGYFNRS